MRGRLAARPWKPEGPAEPESGVSALVDVSFLLLIYFLVTTTILKEERDLALTTPRGGGTAEVPMVIEVRAGGEVVLHPGPREWLVSGDPGDRHLPVLRNQLVSVQSLAPAAEPLIVIRAHGGATQQRVIDVLNCLRGVGIERVTFEEG